MHLRVQQTDPLVNVIALEKTICDKRAAAYAFFARHLALDLTPEDARRIAIEEPAEMEVFNTRRPLPPGAISGSAAIAKALAIAYGPRRGL